LIEGVEKRRGAIQVIGQKHLVAELSQRVILIKMHYGSLAAFSIKMIEINCRKSSAAFC
jgi:hypothetical protein